ncbi:MAG TPA: hypothetical protein VFE12_22665, partial [Acetobacteraceae bacterium]|nr:hypothetical protein [Acetobacteraceae bacterium]
MRLVAISAFAALLAASGSAHAATFVVDALANSSSGGVGLATIALTNGQAFTISSSTDDLWSAGPLPRYSDANGLTGNRFATASDDSGQPVGTLIGADFGLWSQHSISAPFGSLVGEIGGVFKELDANFSGAAWGAGTLNLYYWDQNNGDNFGNITFN